MYSVVEGAGLVETQSLSAPWGEIETEFVIFTVPVSVFAVVDLAHACEVLNVMFSTLLAFLADESASPFRVVFDVEIGHPSAAIDYPLFLPIEFAEVILTATAPCDSLIQMLHRIAKLSLPSSDLPNEAREALVLLAVYSAGLKVWPDKQDEILALVHTSSPLWVPLLKIYTESSQEMFPRAIAQIRPKLIPGASGAVPLDRVFVKTLSKLCDQDFTKEFYGKGGFFAVRRRSTESTPSEGLLDYSLDLDEVVEGPM
jgi:hypothetical protein